VLKATFRDQDLSFRHFPRSKCAELRWQAGRDVFDKVVMPDGAVRLVERFELLAWSATSAGPEWASIAKMWASPRQGRFI
jgi:hypothetical protein